VSTDSASSRPKHPRPSVVTLSCIFVAVTAFLTLTELITALMDWATVDMQEGLQPWRRGLAASGIELTTTELLQFLRPWALALVPFTISTLVFAIYALRGDRTARLITTMLAVVAGFVSLPFGIFGVLQAAMLFASAGALWTSDASRWYRGEPTIEMPVAGLEAQPADPQPARLLPTDDGSTVPVPLPAGTMPTLRPTSVLTAGLLTILGSLAAAGFAAVFLAVYTFARAEYVEAVRTGPFSDLITQEELELAMQFSFWGSLVILPLALAGIIGGIALLARRRTGRTATLWWAWTTAALGVVMLPVGLLATAGAGTVIVLLRRDDARRWTASR